MVWVILNADINIIILVITFMQSIHNYIPLTNHVSSVYNVSAILYLQWVLHVILFRPPNTRTFRTVCIITIIIIIIIRFKIKAFYMLHV